MLRPTPVMLLLSGCIRPVHCALRADRDFWFALAVSMLCVSDVIASPPPSGFFFLRGKAVACAQGTFKDYTGNGPCLGCPEGFTTTPGTVAMTNGSACNREPRGEVQEDGRTHKLLQACTTLLGCLQA